MKSAPLPPDEPERLEALRALQILDTHGEAAFEELTQLAAQICGTPMAALTFVDADRLWIKSFVGVGVRELPRELAFCAHALLGDEILAIPDTASDVRFADNPFVVAGPSIRSYFGVPFKARSGHRMGMLCVLDHVPRQLTAEQLTALRMLGRQVEAQLDLRLRLREEEVAAGTVAVARDLTASRQDAEALRRESEFRAAIVHSALDGIVVVDGAGRVIEVNPAAEAMLGWKRAEIIGQDIVARVVPERVIEAYRSVFARFLSAPVSEVLHRRFQLPALRADGTEFPLELSTTIVHVGHEPRFVGFLRDITARKNAERMQSRNLRQSTLRADVGVAFTRSNALRDILRRCVEAIVEQLDVGLAGIWVRSRRTGRFELQAVAGPCAAEEPEIASDLQALAMGALAREGGPSVGSLVDDASPVDRAWAARAEVTAFVRHPLALDSGVVGAIVLLGHSPIGEAHEALASIADIIALGIEHKHGEDALRIAKEAAESAARTKSAFLANMSHELRTPLNAILGFGHLLAGQSYGKLNETQSEFLNDVLVSGEHMLRLVGDLLELRRLEEGAGDLVPTRIQLHDAVDLAAQHVSPLARKKAHTLTIALDDPLPEVIADPKAVTQILVNLLSNAIGFTPDGGEVGVRAHADAGHVTLEVHDNGVGIAPEHQANLFDYFEQSGAKNAHEMSGSGVGLALTRALVQRLGGEISVASALGVGSVFMVKLRRAGLTMLPQPRAAS